MFTVFSSNSLSSDPPSSLSWLFLIVEATLDFLFIFLGSSSLSDGVNTFDLLGLLLLFDMTLIISITEFSECFSVSFFYSTKAETSECTLSIASGLDKSPLFRSFYSPSPPPSPPPSFDYSPYSLSLIGWTT